MIRKNIIIALIIIILTTFSGCVGENTIKIDKAPYPVTEYNVSVTKEPKKIASLSTYATDILEKLGYESKIIGYSNNDKFETENKIGTEESPNFEKIKELSPQYIFTTSPLSYKQIKQMDELNVKVIVLTKKENEEELKKDYYKITAIMEGYIVAEEKINKTKSE